MLIESRKALQVNILLATAYNRMKIGSMEMQYFRGITFAYMGIVTYFNHVRYEVSKKEDGILIRIPGRQYSIFKPPVLIQFQVVADNILHV